MAGLPLLVPLWFVAAGAPDGSKVPCSEVYGGRAALCERVACDKKYEALFGSWSGPFEAYDKAIKDFRPYQNQVSYSPSDCLKNLESGDVFIIGRKTDLYPAFKDQPAKKVQGLSITGARAGDPSKPFFTTVAEGEVVNYELLFNDPIAELSIWRYVAPAKGFSPEMVFTVVEARDLLEKAAQKRVITVTLQVGSAASPYWLGVVAKGYHSLALPKK